MKDQVNPTKAKSYSKILKKKLPVILTREPGGTIGAERIRDLILKDYFHKNKSQKFHKYTDTLLYLAARSENVEIYKKNYKSLRKPLFKTAI